LSFARRVINMTFKERVCMVKILKELLMKTLVYIKESQAAL